MIYILFLIMFGLLLIFGGSNGFKTFCSFLLNFLLIMSYLYLSYLSFNSLFLGTILCLLALLNSLFLLNGVNVKTVSSFKSVIIVFGIMFFFISLFVSIASGYGFTEESRELIGVYFFNINYSMQDVFISVLLISSIGTIIDTSISVSSALCEVEKNNLNLSKKELFSSGMNIGKDILSTTINTLYFASLIALLTFVFWNYGGSLSQIINDKLLFQEILELVAAFIASIIIIPVTAYITTNNLLKKE